MSLSVLLKSGFVRVGSWQTSECRPHRLPLLKYQPGLYAFVIAETVMYVGIAGVLHRRLRNYSKRAFANGGKPPREVHTNIAATVSGQGVVDVYAKLMPGSDQAMLLAMETELIKALQPAWNRTHRVQERQLVHLLRL
jgi:excinuclease UvrABC nuclease subunit